MTPDQASNRVAYGTRRVTPQRQRISSAAAAMPGAFTVDDLMERLSRCCEPPGTATLYRAVAALETTGFLERVGERSGAALYVHCAGHRGHHHHLVCTGCGRVEATECTITAELDSAHRHSGFTVTGHDVTLYGRCGDCSAADVED